jgi:hypothetical protein
MEEVLTRKADRAKTGSRKAKKAEADEATDTLERRLHPRVPISWPVRLHVEDTIVSGRTVDVSEQGLCIVVSGRPDKIQVGAPYRIDIIMGPKHEVSVTAEVRYLADAVVGLRTRQRLKLV